MLKKILVPTDGSVVATKAVSAAIELAKMTGAALTALHVHPKYPGSPYGTFEGAAELLREDHERQAYTIAERLFSDIRKAAEAAGVAFDSAVVGSNVVWKEIIAVAKRKKCDIICMASHGRSGVKALVLGSETQEVLTHSTLPVLVVR